jgi:hypothetical protein
MEGKMKKGVAVVALALAIVVPLSHASAASARCAAGCDKWCAKNFAMKNPTACSQQCQLKHCK